MNVGQLLLQQLHLHFGHPAITSDDVDLKYEELFQKIEMYRTTLQTLLPNGGSALLNVAKSEHTIALMIAMLCENITFVPCDPDWPETRIAHINALVQPSMVITDVQENLELVDTTSAIHKIVQHLAQLTGHTNIFPNVAWILFTSGSTGKPKGVPITHLNAITFINYCVQTFDDKQPIRVMSIAGFHFDLSVFDIYFTLLTGGNLFLLKNDSEKNIRLIGEFLSKKEITHIYATPTFYEALSEHGKLTIHRPTALRFMLTAGETYPANRLCTFHQLVPQARIFNLFGPSETNVCTAQEIIPNRTPIYKNTFPIGSPIADFELHITNAGELLVKGSGVFHGYIDNSDRHYPFKTINGNIFYETGDLVTQHNDHLYFIGRTDRMIKRRGYRIEPAEIELSLLLHPEIIRSAVLNCMGDDGTPQLAAFIIANEPLSEDGVRSHLLLYIPHYFLPDRYLQVDDFPVTTTGKTDYVTLQQLL
jgi:acyl-coenzyme A synthetase/AMP-(fatty) acid ligase